MDTKNGYVFLFTLFSRSRRQAADVKLAEYSARMALERDRQGCIQIGCGLIDLIQRFVHFKS